MVSAQKVTVRVGVDDLDGDGVVRDVINNYAHGVYADNNGVINIKSGSVESAVRNSLYTTANGKINVSENLKITTHQSGYNGAFANGAGAQVNLGSADVFMKADNSVGLKAASGGKIKSTGNVVINAEEITNARGGVIGATASNVIGVHALVNSSVSIGGELTTNTTGIGVLAAGAGSKVTATSANIKTNGLAGLKAETGGLIELGNANVLVNAVNGLGVNASGNQSQVKSTSNVMVTGFKSGVMGAKADAGGAIDIGGELNSDTEGMGVWVTGLNSKAVAASLNITTDAVTGVKAEAGGVVTVKGDAKVMALVDRNDLSKSLLRDDMRNIQAQGDGSQVNVLGKLTTTTSGIGALAIDGGKINISDANISVAQALVASSGSPGIGLQAARKGVVTVTGGIIDVGAQRGVGAQAINQGDVQLLGGVITAIGEKSIGLQAMQSGTATWESGTINVAASAGMGIAAQVQDAGVLIIKSGTMNLRGDGGFGLQALNHGSLQLSHADLNISMTGKDVTALNSQGGQGKISGDGNITITSLADGSRAVVAEADSSIELEAGLLKSKTQGVGILADGTNAQVKLYQADITSNASYGLNAKNEGVIQISQNSQVISVADDKHAVFSEAGGIITSLGAIDVFTSGKNAVEVYAKGVGSSITLASGAKSSTSGEGANALQVSHGGYITGGAVELHTSGIKAAGISVSSNLTTAQTTANISLDSAIIRTSGASSDGIKVGSLSNSGYASINGALDIELTGAADALGTECEVGAALCITGNNSKFEAMGTEDKRIMSGGYALRMASGYDMNASLKNTALNTTGLLSTLNFSGVTGDSSKLSLINSEVKFGKGNLIINADASSAINVMSDGTYFYGDVNAELGSRLKIFLGNKSYMLGSFSGSANLDIDRTSLWDVTSNSTLNELSNSGVITFQHHENGNFGVFKTIEARNYIGDNGWLNISTHLGDDASPSDKLIIDGGAARGSTTLHVMKYSGLGEPTRNKGIQVVEAKNGATTDLNAFSLNGGIVPGGAYDYRLIRRSDESWYLTSIVDESTDSDDNERAELPLYTAAVAQQLIDASSVIDSMHERKGGGQGWRGLTPDSGPLWARMIRSQGKNSRGLYSSISPNGDNYRFNSSGFMVGFDIWSKKDGPNKLSDAGLYLSYLSSSSDVKDLDGSKAGNNDLKSNIAGAYWSHYFSNGAYFDVVGQIGFHKLHSNSMRMLVLRTKGRSASLSLEAGVPFSIDEKWILEPQIQVKAVRGNLNNSEDLAGLVDFGKAKSFETRFGLRAAYRKQEGTLWTRLDFIRDFEGRSQTTVSALSGKYGLNVPVSLHGNSLALSLGVDKNITKNSYIYASGNIKQRIGNEGSGTIYGFNMGVKLKW